MVAKCFIGALLELDFSFMVVPVVLVMVFIYALISFQVFRSGGRSEGFQERQ